MASSMTNRTAAPASTQASHVTAKRVVAGVIGALVLLGVIAVARLMLLAGSTDSARAVVRLRGVGPLLIGATETWGAAILLVLLVWTSFRSADTLTGLSWPAGLWALGAAVGVVVFNRAALLLVVASSVVAAFERHWGVSGVVRKCVFSGAGVLLLVASAGSWMPTQLVIVPGDGWVTGYILRDNSTETVLLQRRTQKIVQLAPSDIVSPDRPYVDKLCPQNTSPGGGDPL